MTVYGLSICPATRTSPGFSGGRELAAEGGAEADGEAEVVADDAALVPADSAQPVRRSPPDGERGSPDPGAEADVVRHGRVPSGAWATASRVRGWPAMPSVSRHDGAPAHRTPRSASRGFLHHARCGSESRRRPRGGCPQPVNQLSTGQGDWSWIRKPAILAGVDAVNHPRGECVISSSMCKLGSQETLVGADPGDGDGADSGVSCGEVRARRGLRSSVQAGARGALGRRGGLGLGGRRTIGWRGVPAGWRCVPVPPAPHP